MSESDGDELPPEAVPLPELAVDVSEESPAGKKQEDAKKEEEKSEEDAGIADRAAQPPRPRPSPPPPSLPRPPPVPVTLITGFLGAGKSTLVRHLLHARHGLRLAVILNEFGSERGLEADLLRAGAAAAAVPRSLRGGEGVGETSGGASAPVALEDWVELSNGCLCCSAKSGFLSALEGLLAKTAREEEEEAAEEAEEEARRGRSAAAAVAAPSSSSPPPGAAAPARRRRRRPLDGILVETSGLADPGPAATALWADEALEASAALGGVVAVVDAARLVSQLAARRAAGAVNEAARQLAYADVVLVNKVDTLLKGEEEGEGWQREGAEEREGAGEQREGAGEEREGAEEGGAAPRRHRRPPARSPPTLEDVVAAVRAINSEALIVPCERSVVDPRLLLSLRTVGREGVAESGGGGGLRGGGEGDEGASGAGAGGGDGPFPRAGGRGRRQAPPPSLPAPRHDPGISTISWRFPGVALSEERLRAWLERALWPEAPAAPADDGGGGGRGEGTGEPAEGGGGAGEEEERLEIFRLKGLVCLPPRAPAAAAAASGDEEEAEEAAGPGGGEGGGGRGAGGAPGLRRVVVQAVADTYDLLEAGPWPRLDASPGGRGDPHLARFVAIGRGLKGRRGEELVREFEEMVMGRGER